jgi:hypothetical protein
VLDVLAAASLAALSLARAGTEAPIARAPIAQSTASTTSRAASPAGGSSALATRPPSAANPHNTTSENGNTTVTGAKATTKAATTVTTKATTTTATTAPTRKVTATTLAAGAPDVSHKPAVARRSGPRPLLVAISPAASAPGHVVTLEGMGFFSPDGHITVMFGGQAAPVYCPTQTTCDATVPGSGRSTGTVPVTVATDTGVSNAVSFTYAPVASPAPAKGLGRAPKPPAAKKVPNPAH